MQLRSRPTSRIGSGWLSPSRFLNDCIDGIVAGLRESPGDLWRVLDTLPLPASTREIFDRARAEDHGMALPEDVLFPPSAFPFEMGLANPDRSEIVSFDIEDAETMAAVRSALSGDWRHGGAHDDGAELAEQLRDAGVLNESSSPRLDWCKPGVYRLQHASLLFRSDAGTILTDPVFHDDWLWAGTLPPVDAILISHGHPDHFSLSSLMQFPRDTCIVVPRQERASMLCDDMASLLRMSGFTNVIEPAWYSHLRVRDVEIDIYPFYGEQPWVNSTSPAVGLRNAGNTYLLDVEGFKTWLLFDAGHECGHTMDEVARRVVETHGGVDLLASNLRIFPWHPGQIDASGRYLFCFRTEQIENPDAWPTNISITLGPQGVRRLLHATQARAFVPFAHWWHEPGSSNIVIDGMHAEALLADVAWEPTPDVPALAGTELLRWVIGDRIACGPGELRLESFL
jgi:ribonuclease BN (tRNA processing enzyme)